MAAELQPQQTWQPSFFIQFPIVKAVELDQGEIVVEGIASDEGLDLENEIVKASGWLDGLKYLEKHGHFNWDHDPNAIIGDIDEARIVDPEWVEKRFGFRPVGKAIYLKGRIYAPNEEMPEPLQQKLRYARGLLRAGAKLGMSIEGARAKSAVDQMKGQDVLVTYRAVPTACALTPQPVNPRTFLRPVRIAKSLAEAIAGTGEETSLPTLYVCKGVPEELTIRGGGQGQGGERRGDGGADVCVCPRCGEQVPHEKGQPCAEMTCPKCGAPLVGANVARGAEEQGSREGGVSGKQVAKGLRELIAEAMRLANQYRGGRREGPEKDDLQAAARELDVAIADATLQGNRPSRLLRLAQAVARRLRSLIGRRVRKAHVRGYYRTDPRTGKRVYVPPHERRSPSAQARARQRRRPAWARTEERIGGFGGEVVREGKWRDGACWQIRRLPDGRYQVIYELDGGRGGYSSTDRPTLRDAMLEIVREGVSRSASLPDDDQAMRIWRKYFRVYADGLLRFRDPDNLRFLLAVRRKSNESQAVDALDSYRLYRGAHFLRDAALFLRRARELASLQKWIHEQERRIARGEKPSPRWAEIEATLEEKPALSKSALIEAGYGTDSALLRGGAALRRSPLAPGRRARRQTAMNRDPNGGRQQLISGAEVAKALRRLMRIAKARSRRTKRARSHWAEAVARGAKPGSGTRFAALVEDLRERGVRNPEAVAAAIGRRKYGKRRFQQMAAAGRKRKS